MSFATFGGRTLNGNIYLRVQNIFNSGNIRNVYGYTGDPDNDGYLTSEFGLDRQAEILNNEGRDTQAFLDAYSWRLISPGNYFFPRQMYLGVIFNF